MATDTAFAVGVLALLRKRIPTVVNTFYPHSLYSMTAGINGFLWLWFISSPDKKQKSNQMDKKITL